MSRSEIGRPETTAGLPERAVRASCPESDDPRVTRAVEEYLNALKDGRRPDRGQFLAQHPEIAAVLAECLDGLEFIRAAASDLPRPAADSAGHGIEPPVGSQPTAPLGDFRILREVGRGGMGVVYEAEQLSLGRRVALKVLPFAAALDARQLQRFKIEAQAAASLHHPNIVPVHAIGFDRGVHYYAMQFIEGQTLAAAIQGLREVTGMETDADREGPVAPGSGASVSPGGAAETRPALAGLSTEHSTRSREYFRTAARLGVQAAEALEHAHRSGVVHRDVKPANLLIDAAGHLWVTDFGLAHVQGDPRLTVTGDIVGTLRYVSPEQALPGRGVVDHRTDVYALGVTLYEFLTLTPAVGGQDRREVLHRIATQEPCPPRRLNPAIPADLQTIVLKAAAREPGERYATAQELADDLRRFLEDKPIRARKPSLANRAAKWARRHRPLVAAAAVALVAAVVALAVSTVMISRERADAVRQRDAARWAVDEMYTDVAEQWLEQEPHMEELQKKFLLEALNYYHQFAGEQGTEPEVRFDTAMAHRRVGDIYQKLDDRANAETAYAEAIRRFDRLAKDFPSRLGYAEALAQCHHNLATLFFRNKRLAEAEKAFLQAVGLREKLAGDVPSSRHRFDLAVSVGELGWLRQFSGRARDAEECYRRALELLNDLAELQEDPVYHYHLGVTVGRLADLQGDPGDQAQTRQFLKQAVDHLQAVLKAQPRNHTCREHLAGLLGHLARTLVRLDDPGEAEKARRQSLALLERLAEDFPSTPSYRRELAAARQELGEELTSRDRNEDASREFKEALTLHEQLVQEHPESPGMARDLARFLANCPDPQFRDPGRAVRLAEEALRLAPKGGDCWQALGVARYRAGDWAGSVAALSKATDLRSGGDAGEWFFLAMARWQLGDKQAARAWYDRARRWTEENRPNDGGLRRAQAEAAALIGS
jgi:serine/threonine protein kinase